MDNIICGCDILSRLSDDLVGSEFLAPGRRNEAFRVVGGRLKQYRLKLNVDGVRKKIRSGSPP